MMERDGLREKRLTETFLEYVQQLILTGDLAAGERLPPERELAQKTGVSRPVVHEALVRLEEKGLVQIVPRHGVFVVDYLHSGRFETFGSIERFLGGLDEQSISLIVELRRTVELTMIGHAAVEATLDDLAVLQRHLMAEQKEGLRHRDRRVGMEYEFHLILSRACSSKGYALMLSILASYWEGRPAWLATDDELYGQIVGYHTMIVDALMAQDGQRATEVLLTLLDTLVPRPEVGTF